MTDAPKSRLQPSTSRLDALSFAEATPAAISDWVSALPLTNINETATQLDLASAELAQLSAAGPIKLECLEALRPAIHYVCSRLHRTSDGREAKGSNASTLLLNLCNGYKAVVVDLIPIQDSVKHKGGLRDSLAKAMHRLISDLSRVLLRSLQSYAAPPPNFWWELHEVYRLSEALELTGFSMPDDENHAGQSIPIQHAYTRSLLLNTCRSNQLSRSDISQIFNALELWGDQVMLTPEVDEALFVVDLLGNQPPQFAKQTRNLKEPRGLRMDVVTYEIEAYLNGLNSSMPVPDNLNPALLHHLIQAWSSIAARSFKRLKSETPLKVCVGLRAAHYFLSGGVEFTEQIANTDAKLRREVNPFLDVSYESTNKEADDPWSQMARIPENPNIDAPESILLGQQPKPGSSVSYEHFEARADDTSPTGYQIVWTDTSAAPKVGELIAVREEKDARWRIAAVRWLRSQRGETRTGVELLGPKAIPVGLRVIQKVGGPTDYVRGLLLPEVPAIKQAATLITPSVPFSRGHKVNVHRQGLQTTAQLTELRQKTDSFNQFTFRLLDGYLES